MFLRIFQFSAPQSAPFIPLVLIFRSIFKVASKTKQQFGGFQPPEMCTPTIDEYCMQYWRDTMA